MPPSAVLARFTISFSRLLPKKSRAVLKELYPLFRGHKVCRCEDDAEGAARGALKALPQLQESHTLALAPFDSSVPVLLAPGVLLACGAAQLLK